MAANALTREFPDSAGRADVLYMILLQVQDCNKITDGVGTATPQEDVTYRGEWAAAPDVSFIHSRFAQQIIHCCRTVGRSSRHLSSFAMERNHIRRRQTTNILTETNSRCMALSPERLGVATGRSRWLIGAEDYLQTAIPITALGKGCGLEGKV
jgi:hypothetical protein